ncbi:Uncharacterised protein [uncultured Blautia sp.]|nr:Uncharacterised protein [uncultured Blautia sp.]
MIPHNQHYVVTQTLLHTLYYYIIKRRYGQVLKYEKIIYLKQSD